MEKMIQIRDGVRAAVDEAVLPTIVGARMRVPVIEFDPSRDLEEIIERYGSADLIFTVDLRAKTPTEIVWKQIHAGLLTHINSKGFELNSEGLVISPDALTEAARWSNVAWRLAELRAIPGSARSRLRVSLKQERQVTYAAIGKEANKAMAEAGSNVTGTIFLCEILHAT